MKEKEKEIERKYFGFIIFVSWKIEKIWKKGHFIGHHQPSTMYINWGCKQKVE